MQCGDGNETLESENLEPASVSTARRVLILGGGFGGIYAALELERLTRRHIDLDVTLVTRDNYFLFTPTLPEVAAASLSRARSSIPCAGSSNG
jgi:NADH dehydrogenase